MKISRLIKLHEEKGGKALEFSGACRDCGKRVSISSQKQPGGGVQIEGGAVYEISDALFFKCPECFFAERSLKGYRECEVYSRIVGYLRPVSQWNSGKLSEFGRRKCLKV